jgi:HEAT repeat protein
MPRIFELFWRLLPAVRRAERARTLFFLGLLALVSAAQTLGLAGSEALLLAQLGVGRLPQAFVAAALTTVVGSLVYASLVGSTRNDGLFAWMLLGSGLLLFALVPGANAGDARALIALFCLYYLTFAVFMNHFWTFSSDYFDTLTSKRLFPVFALGSSVGGLIGGAGGFALTQRFGAVSLVVGWALLLASAAALLRLARRALRSWGSLELDESDESSMQGMRAAASYLGSSPLGRWLVLYALAMVVALFVAQYLYSGLFAAAYPEPSELAAFVAAYLAITNVIEMVVVLWVTPWLIRSFGVPSAQLVHPLLMLASFAGLGLRYGLAAGVASRMARELADNAVAQPIRSLVYNALPLRLRGRIRAFLEGVAVYAGMAAAGALLLLIREPQPLLLAALGAFAAALYLGTGLLVRREYLRELEAAIRAGRLDLSDVEGIGQFETERLAEVALQLLEAESQRPSRSLLRMLPRIAERGALEPVRAGLAHLHADVRITCIGALGAAREGADVDGLRRACADPQAAVRRAALRALASWPEAARAAATELEALRDDPDAGVRARAAALGGDDGLRVLAAMLASDDGDEVVAAAAQAPVGLADRLSARALDPDARVRVAVLQRLTEIAPDTELPAPVFGEALASPEPRLRSAALRLLALRPDADPTRIARALADAAFSVRSSAVSALSALGADGVRAAQPYLRDGRERAVRAALDVVARAETPSRGELLQRELLHHARELWVSELVQPLLPDGDGSASTFLRLAWRDEGDRHRRLAFHVLELGGNARSVRHIERALRFGAPRARADALEVLSNLGDREAARLLVLRFEGELDAERLAAAAARVHVPADAAALLAASRRAESLWVRAGAAAIDPTLGHNAVGVLTMERLLALRKVPLFETLTLDQLDAVDQLAEERDFAPGEVIVRQGEPGGELYLLLEGSVEVLLDHDLPTQRALRQLTAVDYFGEMAILDDQPRSATIVARERSRLLVLEGASLKELILQMPDIAFEILRELSGRVRTAEQLAQRG